MEVAAKHHEKALQVIILSRNLEILYIYTTNKKLPSIILIRRQSLRFLYLIVSQENYYISQDSMDSN